VFDEHLKRNITVWLFNIKEDPTESVNLAASNKAKLKELLDFYNAYAAKADTVMALSWRYGFQDPDSGTVPPDPEGQHCTGEFNGQRVPGGSPYCHFGREFECFVRGREPDGGSQLGTAAGAITTMACQSACGAKSGCDWWVLRNSSSGALSCELIGGSSITAKDCTGCDMGPKVCPGMGNSPETRAMTLETVAALLREDAPTLAPSSLPQAPGAPAGEEESVLDALSRLDDAGYFNSGM
jgi:hypothetical protein